VLYSGLFGLIDRLQREVPATSVLSASCVASDDTPPQRGWRRPSGRRRIRWLHQVCTDLKFLASDALNLALDWTYGKQKQRLPETCTAL